MIDDHKIETAYAVLVFVAGIWALSQLVYLFRVRTWWRLAVTYWMCSKAGFFSVAAYIWWANTIPETTFRWALYNLVVSHVIAGVMWAFRPTENRLDPHPGDVGHTV